MRNKSIVREIGKKLEEAKNILITSHIRPDWDAIGSVLGLGLALQENGKKVQMVLADRLPEKFQYLPGSEQIQTPDSNEYDLSIVLDCSDFLRVGDALQEEQPDINIDHHITNLKFARLNLVESQSAATSMVLAECFPFWGLEISQPVAIALMSGILGDTLGFRTSNTSAKVLRLCASLMDKGANLAKLYEFILIQNSFEAANYWGMGLQKIQRNGKIVWTTLTLEDRKKALYPGNDDADLINILSAINHYEIAIVFIEQKTGRIKVSWRAKPGWNVAKVALKLGGGGHPAAAGAEIAGTLEEVQQQVLQMTNELLSSENYSSYN